MVLIGISLMASDVEHCLMCLLAMSIKILEENTGSNVFDLSGNNFLLDMSPKARETKAKMKYWGFIKIKSFCTAKEIGKPKDN